MSSFLKFLLGVFMGGVLGAIIGVLLAPRSGSETRQLVRDELNQRYHDSTDGIRTSITDKTHALKEQAKHISEELEETGRRFVGKLSEPGKTEPSEA